MYLYAHITVSMCVQVFPLGSWLFLYLFLLGNGDEVFLVFPSAVYLPCIVLLENLLLQIKDMAEELDMLLECIDEPGGFRDACTVFLRGSVEALEEGMGTLSENCRMLKVIFHCKAHCYFLAQLSCIIISLQV